MVNDDAEHHDIGRPHRFGQSSHLAVIGGSGWPVLSNAI